MKKILFLSAVFALMVSALVLFAYNNSTQPAPEPKINKAVETKKELALKSFEKNGLKRKAAKIDEAYYSPFTSDPCEPRTYDFVDITTNELIKTENFYELKDANHILLQRMYADTDFLHPTLSYQDFLEHDPLLIWQDSDSKWIALKHIDYFFPLETECGLE